MQGQVAAAQVALAMTLCQDQQQWARRVAMVGMASYLTLQGLRLE
jgi:hypothetical protein